MAVPDAAVNFLLVNLTQVISYNYHLASDVKDNMKKLQQEVETLKGLMTDFSNYNQDMESVKLTVKEIRGIIAEAEDAFDTYLLMSLVNKSRNWVSQKFHKWTDYPKLLRDVGRQIEEIGHKVRKVKEENVRNFKALEFQEIRNLNRSENPNQAPQVEEEHVIGFDGAAKELEKMLTKGPERLEVISIVGMLGLGKTTLAKKVYKDPNVDYEFMIRAFVYVSREYNKREVLLQILTSFGQPPNEEVTKMDEARLEEHLRHELLGKQYLVVLDDVWETTDWDRLKNAFPNNDKRCRVLVTTRNAKVATHANPRNPSSLYQLDFLKMEESRELLRWRVFYENHCPEELRDYEVQIVEKCAGLPLAVVVIAGILLNDRQRVGWWIDVADSVKDYIARDTTQTTKVIELMYKHLPNHLKTCFLYLGVFREDFEIPVWKLLRLWISEGLIQQEGNINLEGAAEQILEELVYRNLVMVGKRRSNDKIKTCRMHDTLREFCKREAAEENLFQEIKKNNMTSFSGENADQYRRLCINNVNVMDYISGRPSGKRVRSFLTFTKEETPVERALVQRIPKTFQLLKVLEIQSLIFPSFPPGLCDLVLLSYVAISGNLSSLPQGLSVLWNLQTLIVNTTSPTLKIQVDIWKLPHFRHLHTNASTSFSCLGNIDAVSETNLQTLCTISPESCRKEVFDRTPKLKKLGIHGKVAKLFEIKSGGSSLFAYLSKLTSLENLKLLNDDINFKLYSLPSMKDYLKRLTKLTLANTLLEWEQMGTIGELKNLEVLKLKDHAFGGKRWQPEKGGFLLLKHLHIGRTDLAVWEMASVDHFPKLKTLQLIGCDKLQSIPRGLADIPSLQLVVLHCTNPQVAASARRLQVLKLEQANKDNRTIIFKVSVYPPDH